LIKVYNENNSGAYSLAIGEQEFFGIDLWAQIVTWVPIIFYWSKFDIRTYIPIFLLLSYYFIIFYKKNFLKRRENTLVVKIQIFFTLFNFHILT